MEIKEFLHLVLKEDINKVTPLRGGMMNESFLVKTSKNKYVFYLPTAQANEMVNRELEKQDQLIVYQLGGTSKNIYFNVDKGIKINEYIEGQSLDKINSFDYSKISKLLHLIHNSKALSNADYLPFERFIKYENEMMSLHHDIDNVYNELREYIFSKQDYLSSLDKVFSHNDFQKSNIIKGLDKYFVIDFEFTGNNHELYDVACFANNDLKDGEKLLEAYRQTPNKEDYFIFYMWRILISLQWRNVALIKHYRGEGEKHGYNFLVVANHFIENAKQAYKKLKKLECK